MARFEIEQYELHVATYEVKARSAAEAIEKLLNGDGGPLEESEYVETCSQVGMPVEDNVELVEELRELGVQTWGSVIPSIRGVRHVHAGNEMA